MQDLQERLGPFADAFENVMKEVREKFQDSYKHRGMFESLQEFAAAVNWQVISPCLHYTTFELQFSCAHESLSDAFSPCNFLSKHFSYL